jgi:hypothetical protein
VLGDQRKAGEGPLGAPEGMVEWEEALLSLHWLEGRLAYQLGEAQEAGALLEAVRRTLIDRRLLPEAALATLDLGLLWLVTGRGREVGTLVEEIETVFAGRPGFDLALSVLAQPATDAAAGRLSPETWSSIAPILRVAFRLQGVPLQPVLFA